jgi:histidine phosphotransferase ChpT
MRYDTDANRSAAAEAFMSDRLTAPLTIGALDLAALLCSRLCHDLISPVGAIINGLEVMEEDKDEETKTFALDLIKKSATQASAKLQFCRLAFGAAGSAGAQIELADAEKVARGLLEDGKTTLVWNLPRALVAKNRAKLLLNMLLVAGGTIPRGGTLTVEPMSEGYQVSARGLNARLGPATADLLAGTPAEPVNAHAIQPVYTGILARDCGLVISVGVQADAVVVTAC